MDLAADLITTVRARAGLTQRELAARAGTSAPAICDYEAGRRTPRVDTLARIVRAAGAELGLAVDWPARPALDLRRNARVLQDLLGLADALPHRSSPTLEYPPFATPAG